MPTKPKTFLHACWQGDLDEVARLLDNGARINQIGRDGNAGVHIAIRERNLPLLRLLVERGAACFTLGEKSFSVGENAVKLAVEEGFIEGLYYLAEEKGLSLQQAKGEDPAMLLFSAVEGTGTTDNILMLRELVEFRKLDPKKAIMPDGYNLLHASELLGVSTGVTEYLLARGLDPNIEFVPAEEEEQEEELEDQYREEFPLDFELDQPADKSAPEETAGAETAGDEDEDEYDEDEDYDYADESDEGDYIERLAGLPLIMAAYNCQIDRVMLYLRHGADPAKKNFAGKSALDAVTADDPDFEDLKENFKKIEIAIRQSMEKKLKPLDPRSKLLRACELGDLAEVGQLLALHRNDPGYIDDADELGTAPLHVAMKTRNLDLLRLLVENDADPYQAETYSPYYAALPIEIAAENGFIEGIKYLVEGKGVPLWPVEDRPAEDLLFSAGTVQVLRYLVEKQGLDPRKAVRETGEDLLMSLEERGNAMPHLEYLLDSGLDPKEEHELNGEPDSQSLKAKYGGLPLVRAVFNARADLVDLYLRHKADPLQWNNHDNSAMDALAENKNPRKEYNEAAFAQIGKMLEKAVEGTYGQPPPAPPSGVQPA